jgi:hypothetical protein
LLLSHEFHRSRQWDRIAIHRNFGVDSATPYSPLFISVLRRCQIMANTESKPVSFQEAINTSESNIRRMEEDLGLLVALEQDRRAATLRLEIASAWERHKRLVRCSESGCQCADNCQCASDCACAG